MMTLGEMMRQQLQEMRDRLQTLSVREIKNFLNLNSLVNGLPA